MRLSKKNKQRLKKANPRPTIIQQDTGWISANDIRSILEEKASGGAKLKSNRNGRRAHKQGELLSLPVWTAIRHQFDTVKMTITECEVIDDEI